MREIAKSEASLGCFRLQPPLSRNISDTGTCLRVRSYKHGVSLGTHHMDILVMNSRLTFITE